jgi:hypothetical protein
MLQRASALNRERKTGFELFDTIFVNSKDEFINYPIIAKQDGKLLGFQLWMNMPSDVEALRVNPTNSRIRMAQNLIGDEVLISWITTNNEPIVYKKGDVIMNIVMKVTRPKNIKQISSKITFDKVVYQTTNEHLKIDRNFQIALPIIAIDNSMPITVLDSIIGYDDEVIDTTKSTAESLTVVPAQDIRNSKIINVIPNPMVDRADVTYSIADDETVVTMRLFNLLGVEVKMLINGERMPIGIFRQRLVADGVPEGVYILRLETVSKGKMETSIEKVVVIR